jgi:sugar/nucleoside kinase (ribokinase family)
MDNTVAKKIDEFFPNIVVMTKGSAGVLVSDGKSQYSAKPNSDRVVVDTTGAGDSFASGFLSEFMRTADIEKSIQLGMANSEGCLSEVGAKHGLLKKGQAFKRVEVMKSN